MARTRSAGNGPGPPPAVGRSRRGRRGRPATGAQAQTQARRPTRGRPKKVTESSPIPPQTPRNLQNVPSTSESQQSSLPPSAYGTPPRRTARVNGERAQSISLSQVSAGHSDAEHEFASESIAGNSTANSDDEGDDKLPDREYMDSRAQVLNQVPAGGDIGIGPAVQAQVPGSSRKGPGFGRGTSSEVETRPHSQSELDADDMNVMRSICLDDLNHAAGRLLQQLLTPLEMPINARLLSLHREAFSAYLSLYPHEDTFIDWRNIVHSLDPDVSLKAQGVLAAANLTILVDELVRIAHGLDPTALLKRLDEDFPDPFLPWSDGLTAEDEPWSLTDQAVRVALDIRTQHFIAALLKSIDGGDTIQPDHVIQMTSLVFAHSPGPNDAPSSPSDRLLTRVAGYKPPIPDDVQEKSEERINTILQHDAFSSFTEFISFLKNRFPLTGDSGLIPILIDLASEQYKKIQSSLVDFPDGSSANRESSSVSVDPVDEDPQPVSQPLSQGIIRPHVPIDNPIRINRSTVGKLMDLQKQASQQAREVSRPASTLPDPGSDAYFRDILNRISPNRISSSRLPCSSSRNEPGQLADRPPTSFQSTQSRKRRRAEGEEEDEEEEEDDDDDDDDEFDDDFQQDTRVLDGTSRRAEIDYRALPPPHKRPRTGPHSSMPSTRPAVPSSSALQSRTEPRTRNPDSSASDEDSEATEDLDRERDQNPGRERQEQTPDYRAISQQNRIRSHQPGQSSAQERPVQKRVPWSNGDVDKLLRYIHKFHCSWVKIFKHANPVPEDEDGPTPPYVPDQHFQHYRDQQAIRDKARNLKVDFLKADLPLPPSFDGVILSPKERNILIARGRNPNRRESDVDADGRPTNLEDTGPS